jgi:glycosyltransferase 2 family protein
MIGDSSRQRQRWGWAVIGARWLAGLIVIAALMHFLPVGSLRAAVARIPPSVLVSTLIGYLLAHAVGILKWRMVVNAAGAGLDFSTSAQCYAGGLFGTLFLPSIVGGDVIRLAVGLRRSVRPAAVLAGNVVDRSLDVTAQGGLVLLGLALLPQAVPREFAGRSKLYLLVGATLGAILLVCSIALWKRVIAKGRSIRFRRRLVRLRHAWRSVSRRPHVLLLGWGLGTCIQSTFLLLTARLAVYCGLNLPFRMWFFAWPLAKIAALLPLTQGGIGVREAALVGLLAPFGASKPLVLAAGLVWEGVIVAGGLVSGIVAFALRRITLSAV